jgi:hypothetical protein
MNGEERWHIIVDKDIIVWLKMHGSVSGFLNRLCRDKMYEEYQRLAHSL